MKKFDDTKHNPAVALQLMWNHMKMHRERPQQQQQKSIPPKLDQPKCGKPKQSNFYVPIWYTALVAETAASSSAVSFCP